MALQSCAQVILLWLCSPVCILLRATHAPSLPTALQTRGTCSFLLVPFHLSTGHGDVGGDAVRFRGGEGTMAGNRLTMLFLPLSAWLVSVAKERNRPPAASAR